MTSERKFGFTTRQLHAGQAPDPTTGSRAVPIYQTTSYQFRDTEHAANLFALQGIRQHLHAHHEPHHRRARAAPGRPGRRRGRRWPPASGHAAQAMAILTLCGAGDHIVTSSRLYGGTYNQFTYTFPRIGIDVTFVDPTDPANFEKAIRPNTKIIYGETLGNPDIASSPSRRSPPSPRRTTIPMMIDNTFATPYLCRPFEWGANIIVHSTTKFLGGHGTTIGGVIVDGGNFDWRSGRFANFTTPDPSYHGLVYADLVARPAALHPQGARADPARHRRLPGAVQQLADDPGHRDAEPAHGPPRAATPRRWPSSWQSHPTVKWVSYPGLTSHPDHERAKKYLPKGAGRDPGLWHQGRRRGRPEVHRQPASSSATWPTSATPRAWPSTRPRTTHSQLTRGGDGHGRRHP